MRLQRGITLLVELTPLGMLCRTAKFAGARDELAIALSAYNGFLSILDCKEKRDSLKAVEFAAAGSDELFSEVRNLSEDFGKAIQRLLFESHSGLGGLTRKYGVF